MIEGTEVSVTEGGRTYRGTYVLDEADDGNTYVIVSLDGYGTKQAVLGGVSADFIARDLLRALIRQGPAQAM